VRGEVHVAVFTQLAAGRDRAIRAEVDGFQI
jgi:hypothetical protein